MSRVIYGTRVSLEVGIIGTGISTMIGVAIGMLAGFYRGWVDMLLSRLVDVVLSIPLLLLGLGIGAACAVRGCVNGAIQPGLGVIIFLIALATWPYIARIVRGLVLSMREREFVEAARALGASDMRIMFREILPNLDGADHRLRQPADPHEHPARGGSVVSGRGHPPSDRELGPDDRLRHADLQHRVVVHGLPRPRAALDRAGLQSAGRRAAGRPEPEERPMRAIGTPNRRRLR